MTVVEFEHLLRYFVPLRDRHHRHYTLGGGLRKNPALQGTRQRPAERHGQKALLFAGLPQEQPAAALPSRQLWRLAARGFGHNPQPTRYDTTTQ